MTRPRGEATRRRLLDEAIKQFGRGGYEGTSLESVAGAAGVRKQTLLYYFPSKEALLEACIGKTSERVAAALSEALEAESSSSRKAEAVIHTIFRLAEEWPEFPQFVREAGRLGPDVVERFAGVLEPLRLRALACLSSRVAFGVRITPDLLARIDRAEQAVRSLGFSTVRVRHFGPRATIEVGTDEIWRLVRHPGFPALAEALRALGWTEVEVDPIGYRQGRMNVLT